jgi:GAF domain-containing protein
MMVGGTGEAGQKMLANKHQIPAGKGLVGRAGQTANTVLVPDVSQEDGWLPNPLLPDTKAEAAVPILSGQEVLGVLDVQHNVAGGLGQTDADLLRSIANQVAVALRNAQTYEEAQRHAAQESLVNEINQKILSTTTMKEALQVAVRELGRASGASGTRVQLKSSTPTQNGRNS